MRAVLLAWAQIVSRPIRCVAVRVDRHAVQFTRNPVAVPSRRLSKTMWFTNPDLNTLYLDIYKKRKKMSFYRQYRPGKFAFLTVRYQRTTRYYQITPNWFPSETSTSFVHFWRQLSPVHCPELSTAYGIPPIVENFIFRVRTISEFVHSGFLWVPDRNEFYSSRRQWKKKKPLFINNARTVWTF